MTSYSWQYKQSGSKPYVNPVPYMAGYLNYVGEGSNISDSAWEYPGNFSLSAAAGSRLRNALGSSAHGTSRASLGVSAVGWRQSAQMITSRSLQIVRAANSFRRGRVGEGLSILTGKSSRKERYRKKAGREDWQSLWLEYNFGWAPLLGDIHSALNVFTSVPAFSPIKTGVLDRTWYPRKESWIKSYGRFEYIQFLDEWFVRQSAQAGCSVKVSNRNLQLASAVGLTNPLHIAWDLVPFSFVVDWFVPIGSYLQSIDALYGFEVTRGWTSVRMNGYRHRRVREKQYGSDPYGSETNSVYTGVRRWASIPDVQSPKSLFINAQLDLWKATTAVALVQQVLSQRK